MVQPGFVTVRESLHESEAQVVLALLGSEGIDAIIDEDDAGDMIPSLEESTGVRVMVAAADAVRAAEILEDYEADAGDDIKDEDEDEDEEDDEGE